MERLLVLKLDAIDCSAEASINGVPVARVDAAQTRAVVPIHEYTLAGANRLELTVWPRPAVAVAGAPPVPPLALMTDGKAAAHLRIVLPRAGNAADERSARELAGVSWAPPAGQAYEAPLVLTQEVELPVKFARWRWLDAPPADATPALVQQAASLLTGWMLDLSEGNIEGFIAAVRLRTEELAAAYAQPVDAATERLRAHLHGLLAAGRLDWLPLDTSTLFLRRLAGGRLLECLDASGAPAMRTAPDALGHAQQFPIRMAAVEGKLYVLR